MAARRLTRTFTLRLVVLHETPGPPVGGDPGSSVVQLTARVTAGVIVREDGTDEFLAEAADAGIAMNTSAAAKAASSMPAPAPNPRS